MLALLVFVTVIVVITAGVTLAVDGRFAERKALKNKQLREALTVEQQRVRLAQQALQMIASGDSLPILTAGEALDKILATYNKELR